MLTKDVDNRKVKDVLGMTVKFKHWATKRWRRGVVIGIRHAVVHVMDLKSISHTLRWEEIEEVKE